MTPRNCKTCRYYQDKFCHYFREKPRAIDWQRKDIVHTCEVWTKKG